MTQKLHSEMAALDDMKNTMSDGDYLAVANTLRDSYNSSVNRNGIVQTIIQPQLYQLNLSYDLHFLSQIMDIYQNVYKSMLTIEEDPILFRGRVIHFADFMNSAFINDLKRGQINSLFVPNFRTLTESVLHDRNIQLLIGLKKESPLYDYFLNYFKNIKDFSVFNH